MVTPALKNVLMRSKADLEAQQAKRTEPPPPSPEVLEVHRSDVLKGLTHIESWLRDEANKLLKQKVSEKTLEQYRRNGARLNAERVRGEPIQLEAFKSGSTFYAYRAAVKFCAAERGAQAVKDYQRAKKAGDEITKKAAYQIMLECAADLKFYVTDTTPLQEKKHLEKLGLADPTPGVARKKVGATSRETAKLKDANLIAKKYPSWRSLIWDRLKEINSRWLDQAALAALTGARPEELKSVEVQRDGKLLRIKITGAKVSDTKGQPWREFRINNDASQEFEHLFKLAENTPKIIAVGQDVTDYPDAFSAALARAGQQVLTNAPRMSGYVYRHAFASDLKADGFSREQLAAALGHAVTKTQDTYGRATGGKAGARSLSVTCARPIKVTHDQRFTTAPQIVEEVQTYTTPSWSDLGL